MTDWPRVVNMLPSLRVIVLSNCLLSSANQSLGALNLTNMQELDVSYNFFNHPAASCWFWNLTSLTYLDLGFNHLLYGQLPNALGDMTLLHYLLLSDMKTSVRMIMARLNNLCNLRILYLDSCFTHGSVVDLIEMLPQCSLNKLQLLSLESNQLTGALPKLIEQLTNLVVLDLSENNITGPVLAYIRSMAGLVQLDLSSNKMEGPIPKFIGQFTSLRTLDLSNNHLNGSVPYEIGMLTHMISLSLNNNYLDGVIDEGHFANVRSLYYIDLSYNSFKIDLSSEWRPPLRLCMAHFASCQMGPLFPAWLEWQVDIIEIVISSAGIIDKFPHWFCSSLPNLLYLNMSDNQLYGDLPLHMGNMSLKEVYLSSNLLTGQVPPLPIILTNLDISKNSLSGPLPSNFGSPNLTDCPYSPIASLVAFLDLSSVNVRS
ncbi:hypothetical protein QOZ80_9AG0685330 [Eleusine coracana subsp. coracana]|nr:hypothetical protein QOZ80_9AG0685330 [Eleusine coracana subsp. coracana]